MLFVAEANGQIFRRFAPAYSYQPQPAQQYYQTNGYQGRLTAASGYRSARPSYQYDAYGRAYIVPQNYQYTQRQAAQPSCTCQQAAHQRSRAQQTGQQGLVNRAYRAPTQNSSTPDIARQGNFATQSQPRTVTGQLMPNQPSLQTQTSARQITPAQSAPFVQAAPSNPVNNASSIPVNPSITNPAPTGLSLSSPTAPASNIAPATAIVPAQTETKQEAFSVLEKDE